MPLTCVPTVTLVTGSMVPVAVTLVVMSCTTASAVLYVNSLFFSHPLHMAVASRSVVSVIMLFFFIVCNIV